MDKESRDWPDLLLIDVAKHILDIIKRLLDKHGIQDRMELASLAKREETVHRTVKRILYWIGEEES